MTTKDFRNGLIDCINGCCDANEFFEKIREEDGYAETFKEAHLLTGNDGIVVSAGDMYLQMSFLGVYR